MTRQPASVVGQRPVVVPHSWTWLSPVKANTHLPAYGSPGYLPWSVVAVWGVTTVVLDFSAGFGAGPEALASAGTARARAAATATVPTAGRTMRVRTVVSRRDLGIAVHDTFTETNASDRSGGCNQFQAPAAARQFDRAVDAIEAGQRSGGSDALFSAEPMTGKPGGVTVSVRQAKTV